MILRVVAMVRAEADRVWTAPKVGAKREAGAAERIWRRRKLWREEEERILAAEFMMAEEQERGGQRRLKKVAARGRKAGSSAGFVGYSGQGPGCFRGGIATAGVGEAGVQRSARTARGRGRFVPRRRR